MVRRRVERGGRRLREELRRLLNEYDYLLTVAEVLGVPVSDEGEMLKDILDQHPEYAGFRPGEEIEMEDGTTMNPRLHIAVDGDGILPEYPVVQNLLCWEVLMGHVVQLQGAVQPVVPVLHMLQSQAIRHQLKVVVPAAPQLPLLRGSQVEDTPEDPD